MISHILKSLIKKIIDRKIEITNQDNIVRLNN